MQLEAGVTAILPTPITAIEVIAFGSGGRANTSQDFRVMTPLFINTPFSKKAIISHDCQ